MFRIQDHLPPQSILFQSRSEIVAICPSCGGNKLKVNAKTNAYACYSNFCEPKKIRAALNLAPIEKEFYVKEFSLREFDSIDLRENTSTIIKFFRASDFGLLAKPPPLIVSPKVFNNFRFRYSPDLVLVRYQKWKNGKWVKQFAYREYRKGNWVSNVSFSYDWGIYQPFGDSLSPGKNVLFGEGEKVAYCLSSLGLPTITVPAFGFNPPYLDYFLKKYRIGGIYYLEDNDIQGAKKRQLVQDSCSRLSIPFNSYCFDSEPSGYDVADFIYDIIQTSSICEPEWLRHQVLSKIIF